MPKQPNLPRHPKNPVGQTQRINRAVKGLRRSIDDAQRYAIETLMNWPTTVSNAKFYEFQIDKDDVERLVNEIDRMLKTSRGVGASVRFTEAAYRDGVAKAAENLAGLSDDYVRTVAIRLGDQQVLKRAAYAGARIFEEMKGFAGDTSKDLSRVLFEAVQSGENPHETAKRIRERFGVSKVRAERIARTEITGALRRGRWDEARDAEQQLGMEVRLIHYSALIPGRTRESHARRHGKIVTVAEQAAWYSQDANAINCLCSATEVTVGKDGKPLFGAKMIDRMGQARKGFLKTTKKEEA